MCFSGRDELQKTHFSNFFGQFDSCELTDTINGLVKKKLLNSACDEFHLTATQEEESHAVSWPISALHLSSSAHTF